MTNSSKIAYEKALDLFGAGKFEEAVAAFQAVIAADEQFTDAYEALGRAYYKLDRLDDAIRSMEKLSELCPDYAMAHTNLSIFYMKKGMKEKAEEEKAKATVLNFSKKI